MSNRDIVRGFAEEIWRDRKLDVIDAIFSDDYGDAEIPKPACDSTQRSFVEFFRRYLDYRVTSIDLISEGNRVVHTGENRDDEPSRGPVGTIRLHREVNIVTQRDGLIVGREGVGQSIVLDAAMREPIGRPDITRVPAAS